ncbi:hypothetical protein ACS0TY_002413 [Phlomoides rotata]
MKYTLSHPLSLSSLFSNILTTEIAPPAIDQKRRALRTTDLKWRSSGRDLEDDDAGDPSKKGNPSKIYPPSAGATTAEAKTLARPCGGARRDLWFTSGRKPYEVPQLLPCRSKLLLVCRC